jgi:hypothetical protein
LGAWAEAFVDSIEKPSQEFDAAMMGIYHRDLSEVKSTAKRHLTMLLEKRSHLTV